MVIGFCVQFGLMFHFKNRLLLHSFLAVIVSIILVQTVNAATINLTVHGGEEVTYPLSLAVDDHVVIEFNVVGGQAGSTLDFYVTCPNGTVKASFTNVGNVNYPFVCDQEGEYVLHFSNVASQEDKLVSLDYELEHYILGMPQMLFLTMIVVLVCVGMVAVFILMGKRR
jgi:hypothetical protein